MVSKKRIDKGSFVTAIFDLYEILLLSYRRLPDDSGITEDSVTFLGFDANSEIDYFDLLKTIQKSGQYSKFLVKSALNSHMHTVEMYQRMLDEHALLGHPQYPLSKDDLARILAAQVHPDNRE